MVKIINGIHPITTVKTDQPASKEKIFTIMKILASVIAKAPIKISYVLYVLIKNVAATGVNIGYIKTDLGFGISK